MFSVLNLLHFGGANEQAVVGAGGKITHILYLQPAVRCKCSSVQSYWSNWQPAKAATEKKCFEEHSAIVLPFRFIQLHTQPCALSELSRPNEQNGTWQFMAISRCVWCNWLNWPARNRANPCLAVDLHLQLPSPTHENWLSGPEALGPATASWQRTGNRYICYICYLTWTLLHYCKCEVFRNPLACCTPPSHVFAADLRATFCPLVEVRIALVFSLAKGPWKGRHVCNKPKSLQKCLWWVVVMHKWSPKTCVIWNCSRKVGHVHFCNALIFLDFVLCLGHETKSSATENIHCKFERVHGSSSFNKVFHRIGI